MEDRVRLNNKKDKQIFPIINGDSFEDWKNAVNESGLYADINNNDATSGDNAGVSNAGTKINKAFADSAFLETYTHSKAGTVHTLTKENGGSSIKFVATADYTAGDTFKVNGSDVSAFSQQQTALNTNFFKTGSVVLCFKSGNNLYFLPAIDLTNATGVLPIANGGTGNATGDAATLGGQSSEYYGKKPEIYTATISTSWTGTAAPYTQYITVNGILSTDNPHITPVYSSDNATAISEREAWGYICKAETGANKITFTCFEDKPTVAVTIQIEVLR